MTCICNRNLTIIGSDNGLSPGRWQAIIWTNAGILLIGPLWTNFSEILIEIQSFSFKKMHLKLSSAKWRPLCLSLNVLSPPLQPRKQVLFAEVQHWADYNSAICLSVGSILDNLFIEVKLCWNTYCQISNIRHIQTQILLVSSCSCFWPIHWSQVLGREWRCSWSSADRRCSKYNWMISKIIA